MATISSYGVVARIKAQSNLGSVQRLLCNCIITTISGLSYTDETNKDVHEQTTKNDFEPRITKKDIDDDNQTRE